MANLSNLNVLVIEDMPDLVKFHERWMGMEKVKVFSSLTGKGGVSLLEQNPDIDLVILDMTLPDMNGDQVFFELRKIKPELPVIIYSGYNNRMNSLSDQQNIRMLNKPFFLPTLRSMVGEMSGR